MMHTFMIIETYWRETRTLQPNTWAFTETYFMECRRFCRSIRRRRLNYIRCVKHCPISFDVDQNIAAFACICVLNTPILYKKDFTFIFSQCKNKTLEVLCMHQIRKEGKEGKKQTNRKTWSMQRLQNLFLCFPQ